MPKIGFSSYSEQRVYTTVYNNGQMLTVSYVSCACLEGIMTGWTAKREFVSSGRLQMSTLSSLRLSETKAGVVPSGLIMIVSMAQLSTSILAGKPIVVSQAAILWIVL